MAPAMTGGRSRVKITAKQRLETAYIGLNERNAEVSSLKVSYDIEMSDDLNAFNTSVISLLSNYENITIQFQ